VQRRAIFTQPKLPLRVRMGMLKGRFLKKRYIDIVLTQVLDGQLTTTADVPTSDLQNNGPFRGL
jgi:hypothetical protein